MKKSFISVCLCLIINTTFSQSPYEHLPFSTEKDDFTVWNGEDYVPLFIKGINLGIAKPGTFPGELAATKADYSRWLNLIQKAGFNSIRLYTLHYPQFYAALDSFNRANPNRPIYFFQGIWMEEEIVGYDEDLYQLTPSFETELQGNIQAVHGDGNLSERPGKAWGNYTADVSKYLMGYIIGREIHPPEVWKTNLEHAAETSYTGSYFSIANASPSEVWMTQQLDHTLEYEQTNYDMMHPISFSSWPTLDPMSHPGEKNRYEDSVSIDLTKMDISAPGGYFASYHAYPYYPDFISLQSDYTEAFDYLGQNSYLGYLKDLKAHYQGIPLVIAEFGTSSSWAIAHYAHSGIHHGGATEVQQGKDYLRMFRNIQEAGIAGGIQFAWIDEWFKRTWISDPLDYVPDRRILWQNLASAEQNFGLLGYRKKGPILESWETICTDCPIESIEAGADYSFFRMRLNLGSGFNSNDTLWVSLDTYADDLGETILPNGKSIGHRAEFTIMLTQDNATLFVTQAYDSYGIWHGTSASNQLYRSTASDGAPWKLVRWKNNNTTNEIQFIGRLGVNRLNLPLKSTDAVIVKDESIEFRLPWNLIHFVDPSEKKVMHDDRNTAAREDTTSTGIAVDLLLGNQQYASTTRYSWADWQIPMELEEYTKESYTVIKDGLDQIPSSPIAHADQYSFTESENEVSSIDGVLENDIYFGTQQHESYIVSSTTNGLLQLNTDGSFTYHSIANQSGVDQFTYRTRYGNNWSAPVTVTIELTIPLTVAQVKKELLFYPNPASSYVKFSADQSIDQLEIYSGAGQLLLRTQPNELEGDIPIQKLPKGIYFVRFQLGEESVVRRLIKE